MYKSKDLHVGLSEVESQGFNIDIINKFFTLSGENNKTIVMRKGMIPDVKKLKDAGLYTDENKMHIKSSDPIGSRSREEWNKLMDSNYEHIESDRAIEKEIIRLNKSKDLDIVSAAIDHQVLENIKSFLELSDRNISYLVRVLLYKYASKVGVLPAQNPDFDAMFDKLQNGEIRTI